MRLSHYPFWLVAVNLPILDYLRHSFASRALALGQGLPIIGRLLGHRRVDTTARYAHLVRLRIALV